MNAIYAWHICASEEQNVSCVSATYDSRPSPGFKPQISNAPAKRLCPLYGTRCNACLHCSAEQKPKPTSATQVHQAWEADAKSRAAPNTVGRGHSNLPSKLGKSIEIKCSTKFCCHRRFFHPVPGLQNQTVPPSHRPTFPPSHAPTNTPAFPTPHPPNGRDC